MPATLFYLNEMDYRYLGVLVAMTGAKGKSIYLQDAIQYLCDHNMLGMAPFDQLKKVPKLGRQVGIHPDLSTEARQKLQIQGAKSGMLLRSYIKSLATFLINYHQSTHELWPGKQSTMQLPLTMRKT